MMRVYLCGPMTGKPNFNIPEFDKATKDLRERRYDVVSPAELDNPSFRALCLGCETGSMQHLRELCDRHHLAADSWGDLLARDVKLLADDGIEAVAVLPGWGKSRGATLETYVARLCGLPILQYPDMKPVSAGTLYRTHGLATEAYTSVEAPSVPSLEVETFKRTGKLKTSKWPPPKRYVATPEGVFPQETRVKSATGGEKGSKQEVLGDAAPETLKELARVFGFGRKKYDRLNYLNGYDWSLSYDALQRHLQAFWSGEDLDPESKLHHLAHAAWHCLALMAFSMRKLGKDDRP